MPKFSAYMRGEGAQGEKGDKGEATLITQVNAIAHTSTSTGVFVNYSTDEGDGQTENKVLNFDFYLMQGEAAGFSTKQNATVEMISVGNNPSVTITTSDNSPNDSKVFNFDFKIPKGKEIQNIEQTTSSTTSSGDNIITITYSDNTTSNFTVKNGEQGRASLIDGQVSNTNQLPTGNNYQGRAYLVGETNPKQLWVYLNGQWTNQGVISGAGFGQPTSSIELLNSNEEAFVNVSTDTSSPETAKVFNFHFGIPGVSASASTSTLSASSDASVNVSTSNNNIHFNFGIPQGIIGKDGIGIQSIEKTGTQGLVDTYTITFTDNSTTTYTITNGANGAKGEDGTAAGFGTISVTTSTLNSGSNAQVIITPVQSSPNTAKQFNFDFKIPKGEKGEDGIGSYSSLTFTSTGNNGYRWNNNTIYFDRTDIKRLPINIYNNEKNSIAATFKLTETDSTYSNGAIIYEADEPFDGTLYYIASGQRGTISINSVSMSTNTAVINVGTSTDAILDFYLQKGDTGAAAGFGTISATSSVASGSTPTVSVNTSGSNIAKNISFDFKIPQGPQGIQGIQGPTGDAAGFATPTATANLLTDTTDPTVAITATGSNTAKQFNFVFGIPRGLQGAQGLTGPQGSAATVTTSTSVVLVNGVNNMYVHNVGTSSEAVLEFGLPAFNYISSTVDIEENTSLTTGTIYIVYEDE